MEDIQNTAFTDQANLMQDVDILSIDFDQNDKTGEEDDKDGKSDDDIDLDQLLAEQQMLLKNSPGKKNPETNVHVVMRNLDINLK